MKFNINQSSNPVISRAREERSFDYVTGETASFSGITIKTGILLAIIFGISVLIWMNFEANSQIIMPLFFISSFVGFIFLLLAQFTRAKGLFTILYGITEGIFIGTFSTIVMNFVVGGETIIMTAVMVTFAILAFLLIAYATGIFKVGFGFRKFVFTAMIALVVTLFFSMILSFFNIHIFDTSNPQLMIVITLVMILLASFNLLIDFDDCKRAVQAGLPKQYEWVLSLGLLVSLVWLYIELVRLLLILAERFKD